MGTVEVAAESVPDPTEEGKNLLLGNLYITWISDELDDERADRSLRGLSLWVMIDRV